MAIAFDAKVDATTGTGTSLTFAHTCGGSNRLLFVGFIAINATDPVTGVTYGGVAMTQVVPPVQYITTPSVRFLYLYVLAAPASGSNNVVISTSSSVTVVAESVSYTGANQTSPIDNTNTNSSPSTTSISRTLTPVADNCWIVGVFRNEATNTVTPDAGTTLRTTSNSSVMADTNAAIHPAASTSLGISWSGSAAAGMIIASFVPDVSSANMFAMWDF